MLSCHRPFPLSIGLPRAFNSAAIFCKDMPDSRSVCSHVISSALLGEELASSAGGRAECSERSERSARPHDTFHHLIDHAREQAVHEVGERGVRLTYDERAIPTCAFTLEVDEPGKEGQIYTAYLPIEIVGKDAEAAAARLEPGDDVMLDGRLKDKSHVDATTGQKTSKLIVSSRTVTPAVPRQMMAQAPQTNGGTG